VLDLLLSACCCSLAVLTLPHFAKSKSDLLCTFWGGYLHLQLPNCCDYLCRCMVQSGMAFCATKASGPPVAVDLYWFFQFIWLCEDILSDWRKGIHVIVPLYKGKGVRSECQNYRGITLLSVPGNVFAHVLLARIKPLLLKHIKTTAEWFHTG